MILNDDVLIRVATETDIDVIARISKENCINPWTKEQLQQELYYDFALLVCAVVKKKIVGFISCHITEPEAHLNEIAVEGAFRRKHIATQLLSYCIENSISHKCEYMTLEVRQSNTEAISLYSKFGFKELTIRKSLYTNPNEDAIVMRLDY